MQIFFCIIPLFKKNYRYIQGVLFKINVKYLGTNLHRNEPVHLMWTHKRLVFLYDMEPSHVTERTPLLHSIIAYVRFSSVFLVVTDLLIFISLYNFDKRSWLFSSNIIIFLTWLNKMLYFQWNSSRHHQLYVSKRNTEIYIFTWRLASFWD